jgi:hypothetical protein
VTTPEPGPGDSGSGTTSDPGAGSTGPTGSATPVNPSVAASGQPGATTLTGVVEAGVEPNCLLLDGYLLVGGPKDVIRAGARVTVTGKVEAGLLTTCQQGTPFLVATARPA